MNLKQQIEEHGFAIVENVLFASEVESLIADVSAEAMPEALRGGVRNLMDLVPSVRTLAASDKVRKLVDPILGTDAFVVRATLFDKTPDSNWKVPWHQDVTIAVKERLTCDGYGPWSVKAGVQHVQPPAQILESMLSVRLHLDPCPASNGALRVISGSHRSGKLNHAATQALLETSSPIACEVEAGGALLMRPLLLHASSPSIVPGHRRVIHIDYASMGLASGLEWSELRTAIDTRSFIGAGKGSMKIHGDIVSSIPEMCLRKSRKLTLPERRSCSYSSGVPAGCHRRAPTVAVKAGLACQLRPL